ncbi:MAG: hypothetical protein HRK26_00730 [Rickettsiaceae bacterium H1]|nr:hypothetical protein [Rickettsiaceae bacterium H1]
MGFSSYPIGEIKLTKPTLDMVKTSVFCAPRGFFIFLLAAVSAIDSAILKNEKRKREALYAMYHNTVPFLEVTCIMIPIVILVHRRIFLLRIMSPLICFSIAFFICMTLRVLGIRKDCCDDINHEKESIFDEQGNFQNFSFNIPGCTEKKRSIPEYFYEKSNERYQTVNRNCFHSIVYKFICSLFLSPLIVIQYLDVLFRSVFNGLTLTAENCKEKKQKKLEIPCSTLILLTNIPFCEQKFSKLYNSRVDNFGKNHCKDE